jgi:hypothetical protein
VVSSVPRLKVDRTCEAEQQTTPAPTTSPTPSQPSTPTTVADQLDASAIEKAFLAQLAENGLNSIKAMCDPAYTRWSCFYEGVSNYGGYLRVSLVTDGGWSAADLDTMADQAGKAWFNFIGCEFPNLQIIVVTINGIDHNVSRSGTEADVLC